MTWEVLDAFCSEPFWDYDLAWNTTNPDLTLCMQHTVFVWIPCALLWIFMPLEIYLQKKTVAETLPWSGTNVARIAVALGLAVLCIADMMDALFNRRFENLFMADIVADAFLTATYVLSVVLMVINKLKGRHTSGTLFFFYLIMTAAQLFNYRSTLIRLNKEYRVEDESAFIFQMIHFPLLVTELVFTCVADIRRKSLPFLGHPEKIESPEQSASFASKLVFWWFNKMALLGWRKPLTINDLWQLNPEDKTEHVSSQFDKHWRHSTSFDNSNLLSNDNMNETKAKDQPLSENVFYSPEPRVKERKEVHIAWSLCKTFWSYFCLGSICKLFYDFLQFVNPLILKLLIDHVQSSEPLWKGVFYACLFFINGSIQSVLLGYYFQRMFVLGMRIRTALVSAIYQKSLVLSSSSRKESTVGEIVNLMSVDSQRFMDLMTYLNMVWSAPLQILIAVILLWRMLGPSVLAGLSVMVILLPLNAYIATKTKGFQVKQMEYKDERVKLINEILSGMKVLKLYAWEEAFKNTVLGIRNKEVQQLRNIAFWNSWATLIWSCSPIMVSLASFACFVLVSEDNVLDATTAFVSLSLFNILRFPLSMLPNLITTMVMTSVSVKRINKYMNSEELEDYVIRGKPDEQHIVVFKGNFSWARDTESENSVLHDINLTVKRGSLVAIVGRVGSGKSSLLSAILGDMEKLQGTVTINGTTALVSQQPWIQNATLRDNILFSHAYQKDSYDQVIEACGLVPDLVVLPGGDQTEIGEKGINLSGGQKQRVSLARAVYTSADIYLLDDPLSAVDSHVGRHIFDRVIGNNGLLGSKTRLLVTHGLTYLPQTDIVVVMKEGRIAEIGSFQQLIDNKGPFAEFLSQYLLEVEATDQDKEILEDISQKNPEFLRSISELSSESQKNPEFLRSISELSSESEGPSDHDARLVSTHSINRSVRLQSSVSQHSDTQVKDDKIKNTSMKQKNLIQAEFAETGQVNFSVYVDYLKAVGMKWVSLILLGYFAWQIFAVSSNFWLSSWGNDKPSINGTQNLAQRNLRLGVYASFGFLQGIAIFVGAFACSYGTLWAANSLHHGLLQNVLRSPMSFFDTTPIGRIVNRFSKDIDTLDVTIPMTLRSWLSCFLQVISTIIVVSIQTPIFLSVILPIGIIYYLIQRFYVSTSRQLKRLDSVTRSPVFSHFSETLAGCSTIRAYGAQNRFWRHSNSLVDKNQICYYPSIIANRWLAIRLDFCGNCIILFSALFAILRKEELDAGEVGLSVSYALMVTQTLSWLVRMTSELETNIVAVERILEYTHTPKEAAWLKDFNLPDGWPRDGLVEFKNYSTRYRNGLDLVLKQITCSFPAGKKVGIVGRTGAGKSSLTLSLFRIIEGTEGFICIDGVKVDEIGLHQLRSRITIIPQDPVLFSGTLRLNLDPFSWYSDDQLWEALDHAHLKTFISSLRDGLSHEVVEGGENLSVGQRQLVCLARALLRKTKVLVLDEATAAVDLETDDLIQATIRQAFNDCTVLTIAHRLNTVLDYDSILVLENGYIAEFDSPEVLLQDKTTIFYAMAKDAGLV